MCNATTAEAGINSQKLGYFPFVFPISLNYCEWLENYVTFYRAQPTFNWCARKEIKRLHSRLQKPSRPQTEIENKYHQKTLHLPQTRCYTSRGPWSGDFSGVILTSHVKANEPTFHDLVL